MFLMETHLVSLKISGGKKKKGSVINWSCTYNLSHLSEERIKATDLQALSVSQTDYSLQQICNMQDDDN